MSTVLIVDDSPTECHVLRIHLEKHGFDVEEAHSGEEGLEIAKAKNPDVILMDVVMPGVNGFQATRRLSKDPDTAEIPVIIVTTKDQETDKIWGMRQGAVEYIVKPVTEQMLVDKINEALAS